MNLKKLIERSQNFVKDRAWDKYHTPKNLSMALSIEANELMEIFQWIESSESKDLLKDEKIFQEVKDEIGDIMHILMRLSKIIEIDLIEAYEEKMAKNENKYPISLAKGRTEKYNKLSN